MRKIWKMLLGCAAVIMISASAGLAVGAFVFYYFGRDLPDHKRLKEYVLPQTTYILTADERLITSYARERRIYLALDQMPKMTIWAFLAAEDKSFYENHGIDPIGILRAAFISAQGNHLAGGSTITQQLAKNFFLTSERTISRKVKEMILAFRITRSLSKDRILELYLNKIYLGHGTYGVASAAISYFNKSIEDLSINEIATLAALPKSPSRLDPWKRDNNDALIERRNWVINRMMEEGYINRYEAISAKERPLVLARPDERYIRNAYYFGDEVRKEVVDMYGQECLYECGMLIHTTINTEYQEVAYMALRKGLEKFDKDQGYRGPIININNKLEKFDNVIEAIEEKYTLENNQIALVTDTSEHIAKILLKQGKTGTLEFKNIDWGLTVAARKRNKASRKPASMHDIFEAGDVILVEQSGGAYLLKQIPRVNGAIVVMDTRTSRVLAMVGGYDYKINQFNRATQAQRQPGSVFKPFVYLTALETDKVTPATILRDEPVTVDQGQGLPRWTPRNYNGKYYGAIPVRRGLEQSVNSVTVKLILLAGLKNVIETARKFDIYHGLQRHFSIALGSEAVSPLIMTNAYVMIANGGRSVKPTTIETIQDYSGRVVYKRDTRECTTCRIDPREDDTSVLKHRLPPEPEDNRKLIADPISCYQVLSLLEGVVVHGTGRGARIKGKHIAGKTGTTNDNKDAWFVGLTNEVTVGIYVGYDEPRSLGERATGSRVAVPIFNEFIRNIDIKAGPFDVPVGTTLMRVNRFTGKPDSGSSDACITEAFRVGTEPRTFHSNEDANIEDDYEVDSINKALWSNELPSDDNHYE